MSLTPPRSTGSFSTFLPRNCSISRFSHSYTTTTPATFETISISRLSQGQAVFPTHERFHCFLIDDLAAELCVVTAALDSRPEFPGVM